MYFKEKILFNAEVVRHVLLSKRPSGVGPGLRNFSAPEQGLLANYNRHHPSGGASAAREIDLTWLFGRSHQIKVYPFEEGFPESEAAARLLESVFGVEGDPRDAFVCDWGDTACISAPPVYWDLGIEGIGIRGSLPILFPGNTNIVEAAAYAPLALELYRSGGKVAAPDSSLSILVGDIGRVAVRTQNSPIRSYVGLPNLGELSRLKRQDKIDLLEKQFSVGFSLLT